VVSCNHLDEFDDGFASLGGELNVVSIEFIVELVIRAVVFGFFGCAQVLCFRFGGFIYLFWFFDNLTFF
jgi:hypothetical protein